MNSVVAKWFHKLSFPEEWRQDVVDGAEETLSGGAEPDNPKDFLIKSLYDCEALATFYAEKGINEEILLHTLSDLLIWAKNHYLMTGKIGIGEQDWIRCHLEGRLFRLGRLQFCKGVSECESERHGMKKGERIIEIHIPQGEPLTVESCMDSIACAVSFFDAYFPEYRYEWFTCHSWLLDKELIKFLKPDSNILKFQNMFDMIAYDESDQALKYLFDINPEKTTQNDLQKRVIEHKESGGKLYEGYGVISKSAYAKDQQLKENNI